MADLIENNVKISLEKVPLETDQGILESEQNKWGLPLKEVYKHGLTFYKDKEGKAIHLSYEDRLKLVAYTQQAAHGPLDLNSASPLGVLDVIGRDRRAAWQGLGQISQVQAMAGFLHTLDRLSPLFKPYLEAIQKDLEEKKFQETRREEEEKAHQELQRRVMLEKQKQESNKLTQEQQVQRIKDALNAQTYEQFLEYAQQQYPGNFDQQAILIRQLQDQHYQRYMQQLAIDQKLANCTISEEDDEEASEHDVNKNPDNVAAVEKNSNLNSPDEQSLVETKSMQTAEKDLEGYTTEEYREEDSDGDGFPQIDEARMWTRDEVSQFKDSASSNGGKLTIGHGETVTVRVPTHQGARCLCWEFATDHYDIGFGLYFEWSKSPTTEVTIHVAESDEDDDGDDDGDDEEYIQESDLEVGSSSQRSNLTTRPPVSVVVPIYRRDCHNEVYAGSHTYPGEGVYLLKFDNTYSLWRSKTLYYKVYYTQ